MFRIEKNLNTFFLVKKMKSIFYVILWLIVLNISFTYGCQFTVSPDFFIDLGRLEIEHHKKVEFILKNQSFITYFSICKPLYGLPAKYLINTESNDVRAIIVKKVHNYVKPVMNFDGIWKYVPDDNKNGTRFILKSKMSYNGLFYSISLTFICALDEMEPSFENLDENKGDYTFKWSTPLGCKLFRKSDFNCIYNDGGRNLDIKLLKHPFYYNVPFKNSSIKINICEPVHSRECEDQSSKANCVCFFNKNGQKNLFPGNCSDIINKNFSLAAEYYSPESSRFNQIIIDFKCGSSVFKVASVIISKQKLIITIGSSLDCFTDDHCVIYHRGKKLTLPEGENAIVKTKNTTFLLSACGQLKKDFLWIGGYYGAALKNGLFLNLGTRRSLEVNQNNVKLIFTNGSPCEKKLYKTIIQFRCAKSAAVSLQSQDKCYFLFDWMHPSVCPNVNAVKGCTITEPDFGQTYDMNSNNSNLSFMVFNEIGNFSINLCGKINYTCNSNYDASLCLFNNGKEIVIGKRSTQDLVYDRGALYFESTGEECRQGVQYKSYINIICDFKASNYSEPILNEIQPDPCVFNFKWYTLKTCSQWKQVPCTIRNKNGEEANLTPLRKHTSNYMVHSKNNLHFLLNVCGPLWFGFNETCPIGSGACIILNNVFHSLGMVKSGLKLNAKDEIISFYPNILRCSPKLYTLGTQVIFICDSEEKGPEYVGIESCKHIFIWKTNYACFKRPENDSYLGENSTEIPNKKEYSFVHLKRNATVLVNNYKTLNINNNMTDKAEDSNRTVGIPISFSRYIKKYNIIENSEEKVENSEVIIGKINKERHLSCVAVGSNKSFDLSVLGQRSISLGENSTLHISFCRQMTLHYENCSKVRSCIVNNFTSSFSLGCELEGPMLVKNEVVLGLYNGSLCDKVNNTYYGALFMFACKKNIGLGVPELRNVNYSHFSCKYNFKWFTSVICPDDELSINKAHCNVVNENSSKGLSLSPIFSEGKIQAHNGLNFSINICQNYSVNCGGEICIKKGSKWISLGKIKNSIIFDYNFNRTVISLEEGDICNETKRFSSIMYLRCSENEYGVSETLNWTIREENGCRFMLELESPLCCFHPHTFPYKEIIIGCTGGFVILGAILLTWWFLRSKVQRNLFVYEEISLMTSLTTDSDKKKH